MFRVVVEEKLFVFSSIVGTVFLFVCSGEFSDTWARQPLILPRDDALTDGKKENLYIYRDDVIDGGVIGDL